MSSAGPKKYGLTLPKKSQKASKLPMSSVFGDEESDEEDTMGAVNRNLIKESKRNLLKKQTQQNIEKALAEDPTIFDYDGVYDEMQDTKQTVDPRTKDKVERKSRYVGSLLKAAEKRTKENERRVERKVQKEREEEKGMYDDKEAFVTSAYKEKMRLMQEEQEKEKRMDAIEAAMDVKNQRDMSGFYRHILNQTTGQETSSKIKEENETLKNETTENESNEVDFSQDKDLTEDSSSSSSEESDRDTTIRTKGKQTFHSRNTKDNDRSYRRRKERDSSEEEPSPSVSPKSPGDSRRQNSKRRKHKHSSDEKEKTHKRSRSRSRDRIKDSGKGSKDKQRKERLQYDKKGNSETSTKSKKSKSQTNGTAYTSESQVNNNSDTNDSGNSNIAVDHTSQNGEVANDKEKQTEVVDPMAKYAKRNVGEKFDDARMRYLMRKQQRTVAIVRDED